MPRRITPAQWNSMVRKAQRDEQRAINDWNREARRYNTALKKLERDYNREVDKHNAAVRKERREIEAHNRRAHRTDSG